MCVWHDSFSCVWHDSVICPYTSRRLINFVTRSSISWESQRELYSTVYMISVDVGLTWLIYLPPSYTSWLIQPFHDWKSARTAFYGGHDSFMCVCDMTNSCVCLTWLIHVCVTWFMHTTPPWLIQTPWDLTPDTRHMIPETWAMTPETQDMTPSDVCDMTSAHTVRELFIHVSCHWLLRQATWLKRFEPWLERHGTWLRHVCVIWLVHIQFVTWLLRTWMKRDSKDMSHDSRDTGHDSVICVWHDLFTHSSCIIQTYCFMSLAPQTCNINREIWKMTW